mgnify:CR=1 FL=1
MQNHNNQTQTHTQDLSLGPNFNSELEPKQFHVHDVMDALAYEDQEFTAPEIEAFVIKTFGASSQFSSCSVHGMNSQTVTRFLIERHKVDEVTPGKYKAHGCGCSHS